MQIAQVLAGYSLGGADLLRRAMGKKKPEEMAKQRSIFVEGSTKRGVEEAIAAHIFDLMEKFAGYGFNKSHSAAYALLSYQTAWLKAHYPAAFMSAVLSSDMDKTDKVVTLDRRSAPHAADRRAAGRQQLELHVHGVGRAQHSLRPRRDQRRRAGRRRHARRGASRRNGPFRDLSDLCRRSDANRMNRRVLEALIRSGAADALGANRATLMHALPAAMQLADQTIRARAVGQNDMFGLDGHDAERARGDRERNASGLEPTRAARR